MRLSSLKLGGKLALPGLGEISLEAGWEPSERERVIVWAAYVELVSRITVAPLRPGTGNLREALSSMYQVFVTLRALLRDGGPDLVQRRSGMEASIAEILLGLLNRVVRPVLAEWHPLLRLHEETKPAEIGMQAHENAWESGTKLADRLNSLRKDLIPYLRFLEIVLDVKHSPVEDQNHCTYFVT